VNLLPVPRTIELSDNTVPFRPATHRHDGSLPPQGYEVHIGPGSVELAAADHAGFFYGEATLAQGAGPPRPLGARRDA
jgi:hypothetical protein